MITIYSENITKARVMHLKTSIENNIEEVESILNIIEKLTKEKVWKTYMNKNSKLVIELSLTDESTEEILNKIHKSK